MKATYYKNGIMYNFYTMENTEHKNWLRVVKTTDESESIYYIPVRYISGYRIKINAKSVSAAGGARGLFCFISDCTKNDFMLVWVDKIIDQFVR